MFGSPSLKLAIASLNPCHVTEIPRPGPDRLNSPEHEEYVYRYEKMRRRCRRLKPPTLIYGAMEHHGRQKSSVVLNGVTLLTAKVF
jgi:hypothetical protein